MTAAHRLAGRLRHPRTTVRWRLTLLYGALFLVSGAVLLAITYTLVDNAAVFPQRGLAFFGARPTSVTLGAQTPAFTPSRATEKAIKRVPPPIQHLLHTRQGQKAVGDIVVTQRVADLHQLIIESALALALMALISTALGWVVAGRVLAPLRTMTSATQEISEANLNRRLSMQGPRDELRQLADTIDGLLGRLEGAFDAQRRFVANASHELRTPLTAVRALLEMVLSDPTATVATFRATCEQVLEESEQQEQLIDALLTLAQGQRGIDRAETFDLASVVGAVVGSQEGLAAAHRLDLRSSLAPAMISGDTRLVARLVSNLVDNAIRHNVDGGRVDVSVLSGGRATLTVANTGPVVPEAEVARLLQPFQRLSPDRTSHRDGLGMGLSIVAAIAAAHGAGLAVRARPEGGLEVEVDFPARAAPSLAEPVPVPLSVGGGGTIGIG
ncbi:MAG TPA: ATP-binding protein [Solirubrobacteraceae bacterium]|nr:ATP-binding protein [Solirubrobacteraceae bacterium]